MKSMTCNQLGGPSSCSHQFHAETFEDIAKQSKQHGMNMFHQADPAHLKAMEQMKTLMSEPQAMKDWMKDKQAHFDALPTDAS